MPQYVITATFKINNLNYNWYIPNYQFFVLQFRIFIGNQFGVSSSDVEVTQVASGVTVSFTVSVSSTIASTRVVNAMTNFISTGGSLAPLAANLPALAFVQPSEGISLDSSQSSAALQKDKLSGGAIAGIFFGTVIGFVVLVMVVIIVLRRRARRPSRASAGAQTQSPNYYEMNE